MGRKILVAIELDDESSNQVLSKVAAVVNADDTFAVVHVLEPTSITYVADPTMTGAMYQNSYNTAMDNAGRRLRVLSEPYGVAPVDCHIRYGRVAHEIHELIEEEAFDTLMIGSHGWSGWQRLLGSQANSILHGIPVNTWLFKIEHSSA